MFCFVESPSSEKEAPVSLKASRNLLTQNDKDYRSRVPLEPEVIVVTGDTQKTPEREPRDRHKQGHARTTRETLSRRLFIRLL